MPENSRRIMVLPRVMAQRGLGDQACRWAARRAPGGVRSMCMSSRALVSCPRCGASGLVSSMGSFVPCHRGRASETIRDHPTSVGPRPRGGRALGERSSADDCSGPWQRHRCTGRMEAAMTFEPPVPPQESEARSLARKRLEAKRALGMHAVAYVVVNAFLVLVWWFTNQGGYFWPVWVLAGWGIGLVLNAWDVFGRRPITDTDIDNEMRRGRPTD